MKIFGIIYLEPVIEILCPLNSDATRMSSHYDMNKYTGLVLFSIFGVIILMAALFCVCGNLLNQQSNLAQVGSTSTTANNRMRSGAFISSEGV